MALLEVRDLRVHFHTEDGVVKAVDGISYKVESGETLGIVGESGSGKSVSSLTVMGLTRSRNARISGEILFEGKDLLKASNDELRRIRGNDITMIFQDPLSSLHPFYRVGNQIVENVIAHRGMFLGERIRTTVTRGLRGQFGRPNSEHPNPSSQPAPQSEQNAEHSVPPVVTPQSLEPDKKVGDQIAARVRGSKDVSKKQAFARAVEMLDVVGIPQPRKRAEAYPHEFSGGMRQRAMIAMALANDPKLLIADEPTTALDVTVQAQILELIEDLQGQFQMAVVIITHDLGVVAEMADQIAVMYGGRIVEQADKDTIFNGPEHPYTWGLLSSIPRLDTPRGEELVPIAGRPPSLINLPTGCSFHPRCPYVREAHKRIEPTLEPTGGGDHHRVACLLQSSVRQQLWKELSSGMTPGEAKTNVVGGDAA